VQPYSWFYSYAGALSVTRDTSITIRLVRAVPYVTDFTVSGAGLLQATVVHPPGASHVLHDRTSWVAYYSPSVVQSSAIPADTWTWQLVDAHTWRVSVSTGRTGITGARWNVAEDSLLRAALTECVTTQSTCSD